MSVPGGLCWLVPSCLAKSIIYKSTSIVTKRHASLISKFQRNIQNSKWIIEDDLSSAHAHYLYKTLSPLLVSQNSHTYLFKSHSGSEFCNALMSQIGELLPNQPVPLGYQFIYFNPANGEQTLGTDGYDNHQAPINIKVKDPSTNRHQELFKRRLWVGGKLIFNNENPLRFGQISTCIEQILKIKPIGDSVHVTTDRKFFNSTDMSMREARTLVYTNETFDLGKLKKTASIASNLEKYASAEHSFKLNLTPTTLFRFSALTFNAHKVHYNLQYTQEVEKYPSLLVHGPFTVTILLQWFQQIFPNVHVETFSYKNKFPLFVTDALHLKCNKAGDYTYDVWIENGDNVICCDAKIIAEECV